MKINKQFFYLNNGFLMVYKLYELTYEEVLVVDKDFGLSEQEYDNYSIK